ncbi:hypothetical protein CMV_013233, partial [Castanea mollissima]
CASQPPSPYATVSDSLLVEFNSSLNHNQFMAALPIAAASQGFQFGAKRKGFGFLSRGEDGFQGKACWWLATVWGCVDFGLGLGCRQVEMVLGKLIKINIFMYSI